MKLKDFIFRDENYTEPRDHHPVRESLVSVLIPAKYRNRIATQVMDDFPRYRQPLDLPSLSAMESGTPEQMEKKMKELESSLIWLIIGLAFCVLGALHGLAQGHFSTFFVFLAVGTVFPGRKIASNITQQCIVTYLYDCRSWQFRR